MDSRIGLHLRRRGWWLTLAVLVVLLTGLASSASAVETGSVSGHIYGPSGALEGINVWAYPTAGGTAASAMTGAGGAYTITGLSPGTHRVKAWPDSYNLTHDPDLFSQEYDGFATVVAGSDASGIDITLVAGGSISGYVYDADGLPAQGVRVEAWGVNFYDQGSAYTDVNGYYKISPLQAQDYRVTFDTTEYNVTAEFDLAQVNYPTNVSVTTGVATDDISVDLPLAGTISGRVYAEDWVTELEGITVTAYSTESNGITSMEVVTGPDGVFSITGLAPGDYNVSFNASTYNMTHDPDVLSALYFEPVTVVEGTETYDIEIALMPAGSIAGTVTGPTDERLAGVYVWAYPTEGGPGRSVYTGIDGTYIITGMPEGEYDLRFEVDLSPSLSDAGIVGAGYPDVVTVTPGVAITGKDIKLRLGGAITGTVTAADGITPIVALDVSVDGPGSRSATTDTDGKYVVNGLVEGEYTLQFDTSRYNRANDTDLIAEYHAGALSSDAADVLPISLESTTTDINAALETGGSISGTVYAPDGTTGVGGIQVDAYSLDGVDFAVSVETAFDGTYTLHGIPAGSYEVEFLPWMHNMEEDDGLVSEFYSNARTSEGATPVPVVVGEETSPIDATMEQGGVITGTVYGPDGSTTLEGIYVGAAGDAGSGGDYTDEYGVYWIDGLDEGEYVVQFETDEFNDGNDADLLGVYYADAATPEDALPVPAALNEVTEGINVTLLEGSRLGGVITGDAALLLEDVWVYVVDPISGWEASGYTDENGEWLVHAVPPGEYVVQYLPIHYNNEWGTSYVREYWNNKASAATADPIDVIGPEPHTGLDAQLSQGGLALTATVDVPAGVALSDYQYVELWERRADGSEQCLAWAERNDVVGDTGSFAFRGLTPGNYLLRAEVNAEDAEYYQMWAHNKKPTPGWGYYGPVPEEAWDRPMELADSIAVTANKSVVLTAPATGTVTGWMFDANGDPYWDARVDFLVNGGAAGWLAYDWAWVGEDGLFEADLQPGTYKVRYQFPWEGDPAEVWYSNAGTIADAQTITVTAGGTVTLGGQVFPKPEGSLVEEAAQEFKYSGSWSSWSTAALSGGSYKYTNSPGAQATIDFNGTGLTLLARTGPTFGTMSVTVDDGPPETVDLYSETDAYRRPVFSANDLTDGPHTVVIECTGGIAASSATYINIDAAFLELTPDTTPPDAPSGFTAVGGPTLADLAWEPVAGAAKYTVYQNGSYLGETTGTSYRVTGLSADTTYSFKVTATDAADNESVYAGPLDATTWKGAALIQETDPRFAFTGAWTPHASASYSGGTYKFTNVAGAKSTFTFNGTAFALVARTGTEFGKVSVAIDGGTAQKVDLYSATAVYNTIVYLSPALTEGSHSVEIAYTGDKNPAATGTYVNVDAMIASLTPDTTPPLTPTGITAAGGPGTISVTWNAVSDAAKYRLYKNDILLGEITSTYYNWAGLGAGESYSFKVSAVDEAGNESPKSGAVEATTWPALTTIEQTDARFAYTGAWSTFSAPSLSGGSYAYVNAGGAKTVLSFNGTGVTLLTRKGPEFGKMSVSIDGGGATTVDLYSASALYKQKVYTSPTLAEGNHTVTISWTGTKNAAATSTYINVDAALAALTPDTTPPSAPTGLSATAAGPSAIDVAWNPVADAAKYRLYKSDGTFIIEKSSTAYQVTGLSPETAYGFKVTAVDASGNESTFAGPAYAATTKALLRLEHDDARISRTGAWTSFAASDYSGGSYMFSNTAGTGAVVEFYGTQLDLLVRKGPEFGKMAVTVDGGSPSDIDLYHSSTLYQYRRYSTGVLAEGWHTVKFSWTGRKNASATGTYINIDAIELLDAPLSAKRFEQGGAGFVSAGAWTTWGTTALSGGSYAFTNTAGASTTLSFNGTGFSLVARKGPEFGKAAISIDGGPVVKADLYSATSAYQQTVFRSPVLADGPHTITVSWTGEKNGSATNTYVNIDAIDAVVTPDVTPPAAPTGLTVTATGSTTADLAWAPVADAARYKVYVDGSFAGESASASYQVSGLTPTTGYTFTVTAVDEAGNESAASSGVPGTTSVPSVRLEQNDSRVTVGGSWATYANAALSGGSYAYANAAGAVEVVEFFGTSLDLIARTGPEFGKLAVSIDGGAPVDVDLYSASPVFKARVYTTGALASTWHTAKFSWTGRRNAFATNSYVNIDAFDVIDAPLQAQRLDQAGASCVLAGAWGAWGSPALAGGSYAYASASGAKATFSFTGGGFSLVARTGPEFGRASVRIDGGTPFEVDLYSPATAFQSTVYRSAPLPGGPHTVEVSWTGAKNAAATGTYINVDAIDVSASMP